MKKYKFLKTGRKFLNKKKYGMRANVVWKIKIRNSTPERINAEFSISDCSNHVMLDFYTGPTTDVESHIQKIDRLIEEAQAFKKVYLKALEVHKKELKKLEKKDAK